MSVKKLPLSHPSAWPPSSHYTVARVPNIAHVAWLVIDLGHKRRTAVEQYVMDKVGLVNHWLKLK